MIHRTNAKWSKYLHNRKLSIQLHHFTVTLDPMWANIYYKRTYSFLFNDGLLGVDEDKDL
jgi:hypothetical protein